ncbi:Uncharacterised protein [Plesiomonas shigelloides]|jgi:hypothetical protein|nr:Uncharacterised protein [Plesiomonas shigelloides]SPZ44918.1 Uncharacterised protein [Plesiomonas shigelloides]SUB64461.1 Uncharacterised protein [Plesiomonas shigelloides]
MQGIYCDLFWNRRGVYTGQQFVYPREFGYRIF